MNIELKLDKNKRYILGCSSGPDSMCLFDLLLKNKFNFVVCNIDYNYRENSKEETDLVRDYCVRNNIEFYTKSVHFLNVFGNFEGWARDIRYDYFEEIGLKLDIKNVLIAHNKDDLLETYLMQKERKSIVSYYGLNSSYKRNCMYIERPLLQYRKKELLAYCKQNNIPYIIDPTNADTSYRRNHFRHDVISNLNDQEVQNLLAEINHKNIELQHVKNKCFGLIKYNTYFLKSDFIKLSDFECALLLVSLLNQHKIFYEISYGLVNDLKLAINKHSKSYTLKINENIVLTFDYEYISLIDKRITYSFKFNKESLSNSLFKINQNSTLFSKKIAKLDYFFIKPAKLSKKIDINGKIKNMNRVFIDYKMPHFLRNFFPAIYDENNNLIYMPRYRNNYVVTEESLLIFNVNSLCKYIEKNY